MSPPSDSFSHDPHYFLSTLTQLACPFSASFLPSRRQKARPARLGRQAKEHEHVRWVGNAWMR